MAWIEQKVALFADDILVYLEELEDSFVGLMSLLAQYSRMSGYKLNVSKTQVTTLNFKAPKNLQDKYNLKWEAEALKIFRNNSDFSQLIQANYV